MALLSSVQAAAVLLGQVIEIPLDALPDRRPGLQGTGQLDGVKRTQRVQSDQVAALRQECTVGHNDQIFCLYVVQKITLQQPGCLCAVRTPPLTPGKRRKHFDCGQLGDDGDVVHFRLNPAADMAVNGGLDPHR